MRNKELIEELRSRLRFHGSVGNSVDFRSCERAIKALQDAEILREGDAQGRNIIIRQLEGEIKELRLEAKKQAAIHLEEESKLSELISDQSFAIDQRDRLLEVRLQEINRLKAELQDAEAREEARIKEVNRMSSELERELDGIEEIEEKWKSIIRGLKDDNDRLKAKLSEQVDAGELLVWLSDSIDDDEIQDHLALGNTNLILEQFKKERE